MQILLFAMVFMQSAHGAFLKPSAAQQNPPEQKKVFWAPGMGNEPGKLEWCQNSRFVKILHQSAADANYDLELAQWLNKDSRGGRFAGLHPTDRLNAASEICMQVLEFAARNPNIKIDLFGNSLGGEIMACVLNLLTEGNEGLASIRTVEQNLGLLAITALEIGLKFIPALSHTKVVFQGYEAIVGEIIKQIDTLFAGTDQFEYVLNFLKQELTLAYLPTLERAWIDTYNKIQSRKKQMLGDHQIFVENFITVGTPYGCLPIFNVADKKVKLLHYYSPEDFVAPLIGQRVAPISKNSTNICVYLEGNGTGYCCKSSAPIPTTLRPAKSYVNNYAPGHSALIGNELMAPYFWKTAQHVDQLLGKNVTMIFYNNPTHEPDLFDNEGNKPVNDNSCHCFN